MLERARGIAIWIWCRRTRSWGYIGVVFGVLEMNSDTIKDWIPEHLRGLVPIILGSVTACIGHYNDSRNQS